VSSVSTAENDRLAAALDYLNRGWSVSRRHRYTRAGVAMPGWTDTLRASSRWLRSQAGWSRVLRPT